MHGKHLRLRFLAAGAFTAAAAATLTAALSAPANIAPPDFQSGQAAWVHPPGGIFPGVPGSPPPLVQDPAHPFAANNSGAQPTYRMADVSNPNLKPWVKDAMKKDNDEIQIGRAHV